MTEMKVLVGLSGGVDSAVTAALLKEAGHSVTGIIMSIWDGPARETEGKNACYGPDEWEDLEAAENIASLLEIPLHVVPLAKDYENTVLRHFRDEYAEGRTPNPCIICNAKLKFGSLLEAARSSQIPFDRFATGHYARVTHDPATGRYALLEAVDKKKDQTYFLHRLEQKVLASLLFPLGELTKERVRELARGWNLPVHDKEESKGFYAGDYRELLPFEDREGPIVDTEGNQLGTHRGLWNYTIGQRKGLNLGLPQGTSLFVVRLDKENNRVVVGGKEHLYKREFIADAECWTGPIPDLPLGVELKISNTHPRAAGEIRREAEGQLCIVYHEPQVAIAPGQSAVFYKGDRVVGGAGIRKVLQE